MAREYLTRNANGDEVGLFHCKHEADMPYVVTVNGRVVCKCNTLGDAYRFYNRTAC